MRRIIGGVFGAAVLLAACAGSAGPAETTAPPTSVATTTTSTEPVVAVTTTISTSTTTLPPSGPPLASRGDKNETVEALQFLLNCDGYGDLTVDGDFGPATLAAVEAAQVDLGREVTGAPDDETMGDLSRGCSQSRRLTGDDGVVTVVGNTAPDDPETFQVALLSGTALGVTVTAGLGPLVVVRAADGTEVPPETATTWMIDTTQEYTIEVVAGAEPVTFALAVDITAGVQETGDWILAGDGLSYRGTKLALGDDAQTVIDSVVDFLGHGVRGRYEEFDTDWYTITDPQDLGLRGVYLEGFAFLFFGPDPVHPDRAETLERIRFEGPSDDAAGEPRPARYATTAAGITVNDTLADLKAAYGEAAKHGNNSEEHYYRLADSGGVLCFYFGADEPGDFDVITEIATECRS